MKNSTYLSATMCLLMSCIAFLRAQDPSLGGASNESERILSAKDINPQPSKAMTADPNYSIGAEDVLTIDVWKEPEISRTVPVRTDGKISLPLLNDLQAAGLTPTQLGFEISERLQDVMVNPQVTVIVAQMNSQRIYIVGQVLKGGAYPLLPHMSAVQALSGAGFTPFANLKKIYVVRSEHGQKKILPVNFREAVKERQPQQDLELKVGDTIVVP